MSYGLNKYWTAVGMPRAARNRPFQIPSGRRESGFTERCYGRERFRESLTVGYPQDASHRDACSTMISPWTCCGYVMALGNAQEKRPWDSVPYRENRRGAAETYASHVGENRFVLCVCVTLVTCDDAVRR